MAESQPVKVEPWSSALPQPEIPPPAAAPPPPPAAAPPPAPPLAPLPSPAAAPPPVPPEAPAPVPAPSQASVPLPATASTPDTATNPNPNPNPFASARNRLPENLMYKNRLQEYTQRSCIPLPVYTTINEGYQHAPLFRSTVLVDGASYTSTNTFSHRKAAEQDVAKLALECISKKIKDEGCPLIKEDTVFCKSILNEFAVKMNLEKPTYCTIQPEGLLPVFVSTLVFDGITYTGETGRNKKEAEQLAARAVILSLLGTSGSATLLSEIIKSKVKLYAALHKIKDSNYGTQNMGLSTIQSSENLISNVVETATGTSNVPTGAIPEGSSGMLLQHHQFEKPKPEPFSEPVNLPIAFVPPALEQPLGVFSNSSNKRRKNKKKANKKLRTDAQLSIAAQPLSQAPPCSVAQ